jgi:hypothetical protein
MLRLQRTNTKKITPETYSSKIYNLAESLTISADNDIDKVLAIHDYLFKNFKYNLEPGSPKNINPQREGLQRLEYFLFEKQEGYCTYYASAMVSMLRSLGIEARVVGGFSQGEYVKDLDSYVVTGMNAHAWVEVYFEEYGWITFDPTPPAPNEDKENKQNINDNLDKKALERLKKNKENAENKLKTEPKTKSDFNFDLGIDFDKYVEILAPIAATLWQVIKILLMIFIPTLIILAIALPPIINFLRDMYLQGKISSADDRTQIIRLFKFINRKLRKYNISLKLQKNETALEYIHRINKDKIIAKNKLLITQLEIVANIYNKAVFRHQLHKDDLQTMHKNCNAIVNHVEDNTNILRYIIGYWTK